MPSSSTFDLAPGVLVAGRYRLGRLLGEGGMGSVWVARHEALGSDVAIKFISTEHLGRADLRERFEREAKASARIQSTHVLRTYDHGVDEAGRPFLVMELLDGEDLGTRLDREGQLPFDVVAKILVDVCRGLGKAHAAGIVHRDIKPDNLFLCAEDGDFTTKILDFGIARDLSAEGAAFRTGTGAILGTPAYMSPEQARGRGEVGPAADLYSLAVVVYRAVTGVVPFEREGGGELIMAIMTEPPPDPRMLRQAVGASLAAWFDRALAKDPTKRFASARELASSFLESCEADGVEGSFPRVRAAASLSDARGSGPTPAPRIVPANAISELPTIATDPSKRSGGTFAGSATPPAKPAPTKVWPFVVGGAAAAVVAAAAWLALRAPEHPASPSTSAAAPPPPAASPDVPREAPKASASADAVPPPPAASSQSPQKAAGKPGNPLPPRAGGPTTTTTAKPKGTDWGI